MKKVLLFLFATAFAFNCYAQCTANFTASMSPYNNALLRVALVNTSSPTSVPFGKMALDMVYWGDGNSNPVGHSGTYYHTYASTGTYTVSLVETIVDSFTYALYCKDSIAKSVSVSYLPCATSISSSVSGWTVTVTASTPAGTSGVIYRWNWGDGSPASYGSPASHTYTSGGGKTITLNDSTPTCSYSNVYPITLSGATGCSGLTAGFTFSTSGATVSFSNTSTTSLGKVKSSYWVFGDGGTSTSFNTSHTYSSTGSYLVHLINTWKDSLTGTTLCTDSASKTVTISAPPANKIYGYILQDSAIGPKVNNPVYKVWLINFDSATNILSAVDSLIDSGTFWYVTPFQFNNEASGTYRLKAQLLNGPTSGTSYVPTYHYNSLMWSSATTFYHAGGSTGAKQIAMKVGTATSGPGFIGGNVSAGANKGTSSGIPGMTILLLDASGNPVTYTITDANGDYSFSNLGPAIYSVYPEDAGYTTTPVSITVLNNDPTFTGVDFSRSQSHQTITPNATGIQNVNAATDFAVYPNPAKDKVNVSWKNSNASTVTIIITDVTGKKIHQLTNSTGSAEIRLNDLQKGLYFITLEGNNVRTTQKLLLQ